MTHVVITATPEAELSCQGQKLNGVSDEAYRVGLLWSLGEQDEFGLVR